LQNSYKKLFPWAHKEHFIPFHEIFVGEGVRKKNPRGGYCDFTMMKRQGNIRIHCNKQEEEIQISLLSFIPPRNTTSTVFPPLVHFVKF